MVHMTKRQVAGLLKVRLGQPCNSRIEQISDMIIRGGVSGLRRRINDAATEYDKKMKAVLENDSLSGTGQAEAMKPINEETRAVFERMTPGNYKQAAEKIIAEVKEMNPSTTDPVLEYLTLKEIRDGWADSPILEVESQYKREANTGQPSLFCDSVEQDPRKTLPVPKDVVEDRLENLLMADYPEQRKRLEDNRLAERISEDMIQLVQTVFSATEEDNDGIGTLFS